MRINTPFGFWELARYSVVSILAFAIDFASLIICTEAFKLHYLFSAAIAFSFGVTAAYILSVTWAFKVRSYTRRTPELVLFVAIGIAGLGVNEFVMWNGTEVLGMHYLVSKVASAVLVFFFNFGLRKTLLFSDVSPLVLARK